MSYATVEDIERRLGRNLTTSEETVCAALLHDAAIIIDAFNANATADAKEFVSCRMVVRTIGNGVDAGVPTGATQGSMSALGYSQSWTIGTGSAGELYLGKLEKKLLGACNMIGSYSPVEALVSEEV